MNKCLIVLDCDGVQDLNIIVSKATHNYTFIQCENSMSKVNGNYVGGDYNVILFEK